MPKQLTFADVYVGEFFYMDFGGMDNVQFEKTGEFACRTKKINGPGYLDMPKASPVWEVKSYTQYHEERERAYKRNNVPRVNGHSSTYPYGEH